MFHAPGIRQVVDAGGCIVRRYTYSPFGRVLAVQGTRGSALQYAGEHWDGDAGLLYLRARWYDPTTGRFLTRDPFPGFAALPQTQHAYVYVGNNPARFVDPTGYDADEDPWWQRTGDFTMGALIQFADDVTLEIPLSLLEYHGMAVSPDYVRNSAFQNGRRLGRAASTVVGIVETAEGIILIISGVTIVPVGCAAATAASLPSGPGALVVAGASVGVEAATLTAGGVLVVHGAGVLLHNASDPVHFSRGSGSGSWESDQPNPQNLRKLTNREVRKYGLHQEKQAWGLPGDANLYVDRTTGMVYYQVERGAPYEWLTTMPELKTK